MELLRWTCVAILLVGGVRTSPVQIPLLDTSPAQKSLHETPQAVKKRPLHGRFLHITDFHPDRFYNVYSSTSDENACHRGQGPAGIYGAETSDCDSPVDLINKTMKWIGKELKDSIDFVIWTGDSARHDNDENIPRNEDQVVGLNRLMVDKMAETFGKHNGDEDDDDPNNDYIIPIVPNLGNNDILPHNIFRQGPHKWTRTYANLWRQFIPEAQRHQFEQGGWFYVEVIPNKLAVFSLNTLYFFTSNAAADGCALHSEPGYQQMEWLRIQLQFLRDRGMKAILMGHVPPIREESKTSWDETCWQKYTLWMRQYRDVVISTHYGHFNYDHFVLQDYEDLRKGTRKGKMPNYEIEAEIEEDREVHAKVSSSYFVDLREAWSKLPKPPKSLRLFEELSEAVVEMRESDRPWSYVAQALLDIAKSKKKKERKEEEKQYFKEIGGPYAERFAASFISASVVPNLYPTLRVYEYNITGLDGHSVDDDRTVAVPSFMPPESEASDAEDSVDVTKKKKHKKKKYKFSIPESPSKSSLPGPAYSPQTFSLVRYKQYFANLTHINNDWHSLHDNNDKADFQSAKWKSGKHSGKTKPKDHEPDPKKFKFELHYDTMKDDVYQLEDLTMPRLVDLARRIGKYVPAEVVDQTPNEGNGTWLEHGDEDYAAMMKKKKKHKKHKKRKKGDHSEAWFTFVRRAYVETLSKEELLEEFG